MNECQEMRRFARETSWTAPSLQVVWESTLDAEKIRHNPQSEKCISSYQIITVRSEE